MKEKFGVEIVGWVSGAGPVHADKSLETNTGITRDIVDQNIVRCPDAVAAEEMIKVSIKQKSV